MRYYKNKLKNKIASWIFDSLELLSKDFITYHKRKKSIEFLPGNEINSKNIDTSIAIIIAGPLITKDDFTLNTLRLYRRNFPEAQLILSTWKNSCPKTIRKIEETKTEIVLSTPPENPGIANVNLQIKSTTAAFDCVRKFAPDYVMKTRTDQRIYSNTAVELCLAAIKTFEISGSGVQSERIVTIDLNTYKNRLYSITDMFNFGCTEDMIKYWCVPFDNRQADECVQSDTLLEWAQMELAEVYFTSNFMRCIHREILWTEDDYKAFLRDHFIVLPAAELDLYWPKYTRKEYRNRSYHDHERAEVTFSDWLSLMVLCDGRSV